MNNLQSPTIRSQSSGSAFPGQAEELALDILTLSRSTLLVHLRFLQPALCRLSFCPDPETTLATDGSFLYYHFLHVLKAYRIQKELVMRDYLHTVLHCIFHHPFISRQIDSYTWDLACDIAVEAIITELDLPDTACARSLRQADTLKALCSELPLLTAEKLYRHFRSQHLSPERLSTLRELFQADDHTLWYHLSQTRENQKSSDSSDSSDSSNTQESGKDSPNDSQSSKEQDTEQAGSGQPAPDLSDSEQAGSSQPAPDLSGPNQTGSSQSDSDCSSSDRPNSGRQNSERANSDRPRNSSDRREDEKFWKDISARIQADLETASRHWGDKAGSLIRTLQLANQKKMDYSAFLRRFAVLGEELRINDEEFDYIFYTYGLKLYQKMPLIEPLEYKEVKKIRDFVIAIDTSASVQGELVERFLRQTCEILLQEETFFTKTCIHIIQCDTRIQSDTRITCRRDLEDFLDRLTLKGFGGTDFRPVFRHIHTLRQQGQLTRLKGLLYFTDGAGTYPSAPPPYQTAFLFPDTAADTNAPPWAIKTTLSPDLNNEHFFVSI